MYVRFITQISCVRTFYNGSIRFHQQLGYTCTIKYFWSKIVNICIVTMKSTFILFALVRTTGALSAPAKGFTGVRISLYPKIDGGESLKAAIKTAVSGLPDLGLEVRPDDVSTALLGPETALFEAVRVAFGRACRSEGQPHVSMVCTFSAGCPGEPDGPPLPPRVANGGAVDWVEEAHDLPSRVACQLAVYPLGCPNYMSTIYDVIDEAKKSPAYKQGVKTHFCSMLDGDGIEVFDVVRSSFALARRKNAERGGGGHVTMTATFTANKNAWK